MAAPTPARSAGLAALRAMRGGALADRAFEAAAHGLDARDRAWAQELVYGTLRLRGRLDHRLSALSKRPLPELDADVLDILRLGAYQLLEMDGVPAYAAVSQSVELAKQHRRGAAGFVNGVLQSLRRAGAHAALPTFEDDAVAHLSTWGSHPRWLVERWVERWGADGARALVEANNRRPGLYVRGVGIGRDTAAALLRDAGVATEPVDFATAALRVVDGTAAAALAAPVIVQDPAAGLVADFAGPAAGTVLDLAAAPGGKALALAGEGADAFVVAADRSAARLVRVVENVHRLERAGAAAADGLPLACVVADGRQPPFRAVPLVLLDAPCTGTGTLRRHPDGRWRLRPADVEKLAALQVALLDAAAALVAPGGLLVYSTCSLEPEENELQVAAFLERHTDFVIERGTTPAAALADQTGALRVLPQVHGVDGAYAARLRRGSGPDAG